MKALLGLAVLAAGLVLWDGALARREAEARSAGLRIAPLVAPADREGLEVSALRVASGGREHLFAQRGGRWRCLSWRGALGDAEAIASLVDELLGAEGVVQSADPRRPQDYGLDEPGMLRVALHGPKASLLDPRRDLLAAFDLGRSFGEGDGSFVRRHGESAVWSVDARPAALLRRGEAAGDAEAGRGGSAPGASAVPPLVDRAIVPAGWPGQEPRVQTMRFEPAGEPPFELELRAKPVTEEEFTRGRPPFEWLLRVDGVQRPCAEMLVVTYVNWLLKEPWTGLHEAALLPHLGFDSPRAVLTLAAGGVEPLRLVLGDSPPGGGPAVLNELEGLLYELTPRQAELLFPRAEAFAISATVNPWER